MPEDQNVVAGHMNDIHEQGDHHRLLREAVRADCGRQRVKQRLQKNTASDNVHIHSGIDEDIALHIQRSKQASAEQQQNRA
ncbi:hypothetical protein D3C75_981500 [compost metagenome]